MRISTAITVIFLASTLAALAQRVAEAGTLVSVDSQAIFVPTTIYAMPGEVFRFIATGSAELAATSGGYVTDPDGTILVAPPVGSPAYDAFASSAAPIGIGPGTPSL